MNERERILYNILKWTSNFLTDKEIQITKGAFV